MHYDGKVTLSVVFLLTHLSFVHGLALPNKHQFQRFTLISWDGDVVLGHCLEERDSETRGTSSTVTIRIDCYGDESGPRDDGDSLVLKFPGNDAGGSGSLASELWPAAMASSILLRSTEFRSFVAGKNVVELGCGCGLAGLVAAETSARCLLTDNDEGAVELLRTTTCPLNHDAIQAELSALQLDWRDGVPDRGQDHSSTDLVLGSDIAYYYFLLRPLMDTSRALMGLQKGSTFMVAGQANRQSQWDLYKNIKYGCYNQLTDEHEPPWPGTTKLFLYKLRISAICDSIEDCEYQIESTVPMSVILHHDSLNGKEDGLPFCPFQRVAHEATEFDDENIMKSF